MVVSHTILTARTAEELMENGFDPVIGMMSNGDVASPQLISGIT